MPNTDYPVVVSALSDEFGGGFVALAPDLRDCVGDGATEAEAIADLRLAIGEWIKEARRQKTAIPQPHEASRKLSDERRDLYATLKAQDNILKQHRKALDAAAAELAELRRRLELIEQMYVAGDDLRLGYGLA